MSTARFSVYGDWECKRHRVFLPFGQQKEPYDKVKVWFFGDDYENDDHEKNDVD